MRRRCAVHCPARGGCSACRTRWRRASSGKRRRASVLRRWRARPASSISFTHLWDRRTKRRASHFDNKWRIEETVRDLRFPSHVILRPVFFMENLLAPFSLQGSTLAWALGPGTQLQMIGVDDIGWFGARAFTDAGALNRREIDLAGDVRTMAEAAQTLTEALGRP